MARMQLDRVPNELLLGKYRVLATLGQGSTGTAYLALASGLSSFRKLVVVKELAPDHPHTAKLMDEVRLLTRLDHPNVLQTFELSEDHGSCFLVTEHLDGQPFHKLVERSRPTARGLELKLQIHILCEVLSGLEYAHELRDYDGSPLGVVHGELNPSKIFVTYHGQVKVVDFGLAKNSLAQGLTGGAYVAPEQLLNQPVDARCDVYAVGVLLWEAIARRNSTLPAAATTPIEQRERIEDVEPDVHPQLAAICNRAVAVQLDQRYPSAQALREDLLAYLTASAVHIEPSDINTVMTELFEPDRQIMHQLIERAIVHAGTVQSSLQSVAQSVDPATLHDDLESMGEALQPLAQTPEFSQNQGVFQQTGEVALPVVQSQPRSTALRGIAGVGLAGLSLLVFLGMFQLGRSCNSPHSLATNPPSASALVPQQPAPQQPTPAPSPEPAPTAQPNPTAQSDLTPNSTAPDRSTSSIAHNVEPSPEPANSSSTSHSGRALLPKSQPHPALRVAAVPAPQPQRTAQAAQPERQEPEPDRALKSKTAPGVVSDDMMGTNLRKLRRERGILIDLDDPFKH